MASKKADRAQFVQYFGPVLDALRVLGGSGTPEEVRGEIAKGLKLTNKVLDEQLESGITRFDSQVGWSRFYLSRAGMIDTSRRGVWSLTEKGLATSLTYDQAHEIFLDLVKQFQEQRKLNKGSNVKLSPEAYVNKLVEANDAGKFVETAERSLLEILRDLHPSGFERLCQRLLREAGFTQVVVTGSSGDGGIDGYGILEVNPLVSFKVLFQCKRYKGSVGSDKIRDFRGAMQGRADKGLILTTGTFTAEAKKEALRDGVPPLELVDGEKLVAMFERLELGLKPKTIYEIDYSFFDDYMKA